MAVRPFRVVYEARDNLQRVYKARKVTSCASPEGVIRSAVLYLFAGRADRAIVRLADEDGNITSDEFARLVRRGNTVSFEAK